jgi:hypothetical protein
MTVQSAIKNGTCNIQIGRHVVAIYGTTSPVHATKVHGSLDVQLHSFFNFTLDEGQYLARHPGRFTPSINYVKPGQAAGPVRTLLTREKRLVAAGKQDHDSALFVQRIAQSGDGVTQWPSFLKIRQLGDIHSKPVFVGLRVTKQGYRKSKTICFCTRQRFGTRNSFRLQVE